MEMQAVKKISMKSVCGDYKKFVNRLKEGGSVRDGKFVPAANAPKQLDLMTVIGSATGTESGSGDKGDWTALLGEFEATNVETGEIFQGFKCFLPRDITSFFLNGMKSASSPVCEFAVMVGMRLNETPIGFEYTTRALIPLKASGALNRLRAEAAKALPAPKEEVKSKK